MTQTMEQVVADVRQRAKGWRDEELAALLARDDSRARIAAGKAVVLEQLANDFSHTASRAA